MPGSEIDRRRVPAAAAGGARDLCQPVPLTILEGAAGLADTAGGEPSTAAWRRYFADTDVRRRLVEFLGAAALDEATCHYLSPPRPHPQHPFDPRSPAELWRLLDTAGEAARSLWDRRWLIADLDVEHVHYDRPWEPLRHPRRSRRLQAPVAAAIAALLDEYGIASLHFLTGRGHHWMWCVRRRSACFVELERLGTLDAALQRRYARACPPFTDAVGLTLGAAHHGLGKLMEFLGHRILAAAATAVPVELTAAAVPPGPAGREAISIDLSLYGDPLDRRAVRMPFAPYSKGPPASRRCLVAVPVVAGNEDEAFAARSDLAAARALAARVSTAIPEAAAGTLRLLRHYLRSPLAEVHRTFYAEEPDAAATWPATYDRLELARLPPCVARILGHPNDLLLQPAAIQLVVRTLLGLGWLPRHIAGLLRSKYERDHGWIPDLHFCEPSCRADFYVRLFTGLAVARRGDLRDFDCPSTCDRQFCPQPRCAWDLGSMKSVVRR